MVPYRQYLICCNSSHESFKGCWLAAQFEEKKNVNLMIYLFTYHFLRYNFQLKVINVGFLKEKMVIHSPKLINLQI